MRVGIITTSYPRFEGDYAGGFVAELAEALARRGLTVTVWAPHARGLPRTQLLRGVLVERFRYAPEEFERVAYGDGIANNVRRDRLAAAALPAFALGVRRAARKAGREADVLHVNWAQTAAIVAEARPRAPLVVTLHGSDVRLAREDRHMLTWLRRGTAAPAVAEVIAVSDELAAEAAQLAPGLHATVIPTGVDAGLLDRERVMRHAKGPMRLAFVGRLLESKGTADLAEAFVSLGGDVQLTIAGGGPEEGPLAWRFLQAGAEDRVRFLGAVPHPEALDVMADADIVVVPSHAEGCGVVAIEAAALGVPVVATRVGVHPDLLRHEGLLYEPGDVATLTARLRRLVDDPGTRARFGEELRRRVAKAYTWDALAGDIVAVYEAAAGGTAARAAGRNVGPPGGDGGAA